MNVMIVGIGETARVFRNQIEREIGDLDDEEAELVMDLLVFTRIEEEA